MPVSSIPEGGGMGLEAQSLKLGPGGSFFFEVTVTYRGEKQRSAGTFSPNCNYRRELELREGSGTSQGHTAGQGKIPLLGGEPSFFTPDPCWFPHYPACPLT